MLLLRIFLRTKFYFAWSMILRVHPPDRENYHCKLDESYVLCNFINSPLVSGKGRYGPYRHSAQRFTLRKAKREKSTMKFRWTGTDVSHAYNCSSLWLKGRWINDIYGDHKDTETRERDCTCSSAIASRHIEISFFRRLKTRERFRCFLSARHLRDEISPRRDISLSVRNSRARGARFSRVYGAPRDPQRLYHLSFPV